MYMVLKHIQFNLLLQVLIFFYTLIVNLIGLEYYLLKQFFTVPQKVTYKEALYLETYI